MAYTYPNHCSAAMAANCFGVAKQTICNWSKVNGAPINADGTYSLPQLIQWREARIRKEAATDALKEFEDEGPENTKDPELRRKRAAEATLKEIQVAERCAILIRAEDAELQFRRALTEFRQTFESFPATLARDLENLPALEIAEKLRQHTTAMLNRLAKALNA